LEKDIRDLSLYETFDGKEISVLYDLLYFEIEKMEKEVQSGELTFNGLRALEDRIISFKCLYQDLGIIWSNMIKDGHFNGLRTKNKLYGKEF